MRIFSEPTFPALCVHESDGPVSSCNSWMVRVCGRPARPNFSIKVPEVPFEFRDETRTASLTIVHIANTTNGQTILAAAGYSLMTHLKRKMNNNRIIGITIYLVPMSLFFLDLKVT